MPSPKPKPDERPSRPEWAAALSDREFKFVMEYRLDLNGTQAHLRAFPGEDNPGRRAFDIIHRPHVALAIDKALLEDTSAIRTQLMERWKHITDGDIGDLISWGEIEQNGVKIKASDKLPEGYTRRVKRITITKDGDMKFELHDPLRASELLAKSGPVGLMKDSTTLEAGATFESILRKALDSRNGKTDGDEPKKG